MSLFNENQENDNLKFKGFLMQKQNGFVAFRIFANFTSLYFSARRISLFLILNRFFMSTHLGSYLTFNSIYENLSIYMYIAV